MRTRRHDRSNPIAYRNWDWVGASNMPFATGDILPVEWRAAGFTVPEPTPRPFVVWALYIASDGAMQRWKNQSLAMEEPCLLNAFARASAAFLRCSQAAELPKRSDAASAATGGITTFVPVWIGWREPSKLTSSGSRRRTLRQCEWPTAWVCEGWVGWR